ncbi:MAG TPA: phosphoribosylglycinamide formyltransferase [Thiotrichaceae bacterium]|jgi:phosphoribosylglycinamide formyltransferase-1|nr:phosphoribosylglycinamide formyltransferase [Thiotrichaceae bacterium]HIM07201.1 phosphoribosylglycinamide formyltransferase [Gammaproteobacteria bacterium]
MKKLAVLVSGRGSNMTAIINACEQGTLSASVELVISNNEDSLALELAQEKNIDTCHLSSCTHADANLLDIAMQQVLASHNIDIVLLAGFMKKIGPKTLSAYKGRLINIHPSLLPKFGGQGMFGLNVHNAVIDAGEKETGVTIHLVDGEYDKGAILAQTAVAVGVEDTPESLAAKVLKVEHVLFAETIQKIIDGSIILPAN